MLVVLIPLFDKDMAVSAYSIFTQTDNLMLNPAKLGTGALDGAGMISGLDLITDIGIEALTGGKDVFVPITNVSIFSNIEAQCTVDRNKIILLIDNTFPPVDMYIKRLEELRQAGFRIAIRKLPVSEFENYKPILKLCQFMFLNNKKVVIDKAKIYFNALYPEIELCAGNIETQENFDNLKNEEGYKYFEGSFYRMPVSGNSEKIVPLKMNYIELLNLINSPNFDLTDAADILGKDPALTISLLGMVNRMALRGNISSIRHAVAMLGQKELARWINTAVAKELYADKPSEMTRISLIRAKFAECLSETFGLKAKKDELFLMGLFSVIDAILEKPMEEALSIMQVSDEIRDALIERKGELAPVYEFIREYEDANWHEISRIMVVEDIDMSVVEKAYYDTLMWYRMLIF